eukprot:3315572-Prymnesium_polylepis.1
MHDSRIVAVTKHANLKKKTLGAKNMKKMQPSVEMAPESTDPSPRACRRRAHGARGDGPR